MNHIFKNQMDNRYKRRDIIVFATLLLNPFNLYGSTIRTPYQSEGPFYPNRIPEDSDNNLVKNQFTDKISKGKILKINGSIEEFGGKSIKNLSIEIWQTDANGVYLHKNSFGSSLRDMSFQGYGKAETNESGQFDFMTIVPVSYPGRTPHIHLKVKDRNKELLTTQYYIHGHPGNESDFLYRSLSLSEQELNSMKLKNVSKGNSDEFETRIKIIL